MSEAGRAPILVTMIIAALTVGLGASGYLHYVQYQKAQDDRRQLSGQITDLKYQVEQDHKVTMASPTPDIGASPSPSSAVLGTTAVAFTQLGAHVYTSEPVADLTYQYEAVKSGSYTLAVADLATTSLMSKYPSCRPGVASLGQLVRRPLASRPTSSSTKLIKQIGEYNYYYVPPVGNCGNDAAGRATVTAAQSYVKTAVLPTLAQ